MSNSAVILKIEYKIQESDSWSELNFTPQSAKFNQTSKKDSGGWIHTSKVNFKMAKNQSTTIEPLKTLFLKKAIFRITDGNNTTYVIGNNKIKARLGYDIEVAGTPGGFNGREVEIFWESTTGAVIA